MSAEAEEGGARHQDSPVAVRDLEPPHVAAVAVLLRHDVGGLELLDRGLVTPEPPSGLGVGVGLMGPEAVPGDLTERGDQCGDQPGPGEGFGRTTFGAALHRDRQPSEAVEHVTVRTAHAPGQRRRRHPGGDHYLGSRVAAPAVDPLNAVLQVVEAGGSPLLGDRRHPQTAHVVVYRCSPKLQLGRLIDQLGAGGCPGNQAPCGECRGVAASRYN